MIEHKQSVNTLIWYILDLVKIEDTYGIEFTDETLEVNCFLTIRSSLHILKN